MKNKKTTFHNWGKISYQKAWDKQTEIFDKTVSLKLENRKNKKEGKAEQETDNHLIFCEHTHVYTLGKSGHIEHLLLNNQQLKDKGVEFFKTNRGGDITYHGPGQIVGYPIIDLDNFFTDLHKYLRFMEEVIILTLADYGIIAGRIEGLTGVWIDFEKKQNPRKICAMGVKASRWVTMHGFALNVDPDLSFFNNIVPCGITDKAVTSMAKELGTAPDFSEVQRKLIDNFSKVFEMEYQNQTF